MSHAPPASPSTTQVRAESIGYLALTYVGERLPLQVCSGQLIPDTSIGGFDAIARS